MKKNSTVMLLGGLVALGAAACGEAGQDLGEVTTTTSSALTTTYQAENAFDLDEGVVETVNGGFTGTGYVNIDNAVGTFAWYIINSPVTGTATIRIRYANGTGSNRPIRIVTNGSNGPLLTGAPTGSWTTWVTTAAVTINLTAGNNDLLFVSTTADGMPNIDRFEITQTYTQTFQAENAFDIDEGVVESIHAGFTGTGYVNINNFSNTFAWYIINSPATTTATVRVRYANGGGTNRPIQISAGGGGGGTLTGGPTGAWSTWVLSPAITVSFTAGNNDLVLSSVTSDGMPNIDRFEITY